MRVCVSERVLARSIVAAYLVEKDGSGAQTRDDAVVEHEEARVREALAVAVGYRHDALYVGDALVELVAVPHARILATGANRRGVARELQTDGSFVPCRMP